MSNILRIKRRAAGGAVGAPASLANAELAFNEADDTLYYGKGTGGTGGTATTVEAIGGKGAVVMLSGDQNVAGTKTFSASPNVPTVPTSDSSTKAASTAFVKAVLSTVTLADGDKGDITVSGNGSTFTIDNGAVTLPKMANVNSGVFLGRTSAGAGSVEALTVAQAKALLALAKGDVGLSNVDNTSDANKPVSTAQQSALNLKANLASPAFTGTPTAPTAAVGTNTTQLATTAFVQAAVSRLINSAPTALDTLNELAAALGNDPNFATTVTTSIGTKLSKGANLSDLSDVAAARVNLGLGTLAVQSAAAVVIAGGSISGVTLTDVVLDGGVF